MICKRSGCTKTLRVDNAKGVCSSNCLSSDAPPAARAKGVAIAVTPKAPPAPDEGAALTAGGPAARFRSVHDAMGMDPEKTLEEFYTSWLEGIRQALES